MNKTIGLVALLLLQGTAFAQTNNAARGDLSYTLAELRYVDLDNGGNGLRVNGSYELPNNWIIVGGLTSVSYNNNVDGDIFEIGAGYVWNYSPDWNLVGTARFVNANYDVPGASGDDSGIAVSAGVRGYLVPQLELRGFVNHVNLDNNDTYLEIAGDYYFTRQFSAGVSVEFAGDTDLFSIGARYFFR